MIAQEQQLATTQGNWQSVWLTTCSVQRTVWRLPDGLHCALWTLWRKEEERQMKINAQWTMTCDEWWLIPKGYRIELYMYTVHWYIEYSIEGNIWKDCVTYPSPSNLISVSLHSGSTRPTLTLGDSEWGSECVCVWVCVWGLRGGRQSRQALVTAHSEQSSPSANSKRLHITEEPLEAKWVKVASAQLSPWHWLLRTCYINTVSGPRVISSCPISPHRPLPSPSTSSHIHYSHTHFNRDYIALSPQWIWAQ